MANGPSKESLQLEAMMKNQNKVIEALTKEIKELKDVKGDEEQKMVAKQIERLEKLLEKKEQRAEQQIGRRKIHHAQQQEYRPADRRRGEGGQRRTQRQTGESARASPHRDADKRHGKHREELAQEYRVDGDAGGQYLDDLVGFFLDQIGQDHSGEQHGEQEKAHLAEIERRGGEATEQRSPNDGWPPTTVDKG